MQKRTSRQCSPYLRIDQFLRQRALRSASINRQELLAVECYRRISVWQQARPRLTYFTEEIPCPQTIDKMSSFARVTQAQTLCE